MGRRTGTAEVVPRKAEAEQRYFSGDLLDFLGALRRNNNREWFERNRARFESVVRGPCLNFVAALAPGLAKLNRHFVADPRPVGGSMMRIHRDIRFSKDKSPYRTALGLHFWHEAGKGEGNPGFYLHIEPSASFAGGGMWHPPTPVLGRVRDAIVDNPRRWEKARRAFDENRDWRMVGASLTRVPAGYDPAHRFADDLKRKDLAATAPISDDELCRADIADRVLRRIHEMMPFMEFLTKAAGLPF